MIEPMLPGISIRLIQILCAEHFEIPLEQMRSPSRERKYARPRQFAIALACEFLPAKGTPTIGYYFGGRDHATVLHAQRLVLELADDPLDEARDHLAALRLAIEAHRPEPVQLMLELAAA